MSSKQKLHFSWSRGRYANIVDVSEEGIGGDSPAIIEENFGEESLTFSDRTHQHNGAAFDLDGNLSTSGSQVINLPDYLVGGNYIGSQTTRVTIRHIPLRWKLME